MSGKPATNPTDEKQAWQRVREIIGGETLTLPPRASSGLRRDLTGVISHLARCKFAAKMIGAERRILELRCGEGLGTPILGEQATRYLGVDPDSAAIEAARAAWAGEQVEFRCGDVLAGRFGVFDAAVCLDLADGKNGSCIETILDALAEQVAGEGVVVAGSALMGDELIGAAGERFHNVLPFVMHGEMVRAGVSADAAYAIVVACNRRTEGGA